MVDKYKVRNYIKERIGEEYLIPLLGVWDKAEDIDFDKLPNQFVLKCNHNSGLGMYICKDKSKLTKKQINAIRKNLAKGLKQDYYLTGREWPYKNVPRKIIAEKYMVNDENKGLTDYKFMCFNGKVNCCFVCTDRFIEDGLKITFYDTNWEIMPFRRHYPQSNEPIAKPVNYEKMVKIAEQLSKDIPFVRTDFYEINGELYFGELTFYPASGFEEFIPHTGDEILGKWIQLPETSGGGYLLENNKICLWIHTERRTTSGLTDYKFYCFNGTPKIMMVNSDRGTGNTKADYFDMNYNWLDLKWGYEHAAVRPKKPNGFEKMKKLSAILSQNIPELRVDFYEVKDKIYFGELTFFDGSGFDRIAPKDWDKKLGDWIELPEK